MRNVENHLYPFFWQHGEDEATLRHYIAKMDEAGIKGLTLESRPHPDFVGDQWWQDLSYILDECQKRDMKVWILDDSHFPTGFANGKIKSTYPQYQKQYLVVRRYDLAGPLKGARIDASLLKGRPWVTKQVDIRERIGVYLAPRASKYNQAGDPIDINQVQDISQQWQEDTIYLDVPKGAWSVFVVFASHEGGEEATQEYLNPLQKEATQVLLEEVYEKHAQEVGQHFGKTITAFFSDEPRFGNAKGTQVLMGQSDQVLPWRPGLEQELPFKKEMLPLLWYPDQSGAEKEVRFAYMDVITREYNKNFTKVLADWCQAHGLDYLGHNIEDNGAHARLGYGAGHFFRGQEAQHYSGIDVIGTQIVPGMPYHHDAYQTGGSDGQFYHFALAKLGASAAHLYAHKKKRAMCEAFGAYGWNEGLKTMKWIGDHLLVRGITDLVPHAFSPKPYPDPDCPPHFYAQGQNPQFRYMKKLNDYFNRIMTLCRGGEHRAPLALLYPAELEWADPTAMPIELPARYLTQSQLDFDIVPLDLLETASIVEGKLQINDESFQALVVPQASYYPLKVQKVIEKLHEAGLDVRFVKNDGQLGLWEAVKNFPVVSLEDLGQAFADYVDIHLETPFEDLVYYHFEKEGLSYYFFFNESIYETVNTRVHLASYEPGQLSLPKQGAYAYDAYGNRLEELTDLQLLLEPHQSLFWVFGPEDRVKERLGFPQKAAEGQSAQVLFPMDQATYDQIDLTGPWQLSLAKPLDYPHFEALGQLDQLQVVNSLEGHERSVGTVAYEGSFAIEDSQEVVALRIQEAYETLEVFLNGQSLGVQLAPPYRYDLRGLLKEGLNQIRLEVTNTLGTQHRGSLNQYLMIEPFGIQGPVSLLVAKSRKA